MSLAFLFLSLALCVGGCSDPLSIPATFHSSTIRSYFWPTDTVASYRIDGADIHQFIPLSSGTAIQLNDLTTGQTNVMSVGLSEKEIALEHIDTSNALLPLPNGVVFSDSTTSRNTPYGIRTLYQVRGGYFYAGTDHGIFYTPDDGGTWDSIPETYGKTISSILDDRAGGIYALATTGQVFEIKGQQVLFSGTVPGASAMGYDLATGQLFIGTVTGSLWHFIPPAAFIQVSSRATRNIQSSIIGITGGRYPTVLTATNGIWQVDEISDSSWQIGFGKTGFTAFYTASDNTLYATTSADVLYVSRDSAQSWSLRSFSSTAPIVSFSERSLGDLVAVSSSGEVFEIMEKLGFAVIPQSSLTGHVVQAILWNTDSSVIVLGTNDGLFKKGGNALSWNAASSPTLTDITVVDGRFILLQSDSSDLQAGAHWKAGTITMSPYSFFIPIEAHVIEHLDSLVITQKTGNASTAIYHDVFTVQYAPEDAALRSEASWLIYYARNIGPVLIQQTITGIPHEAVLRKE